MTNDGKKDIKPDLPPDDWVAYIPDKEWLALQNLCDRMEHASKEFQKVIEEAIIVES
jgi:hypothetical protein